MRPTRRSATQLFVSRETVEHHLHKVITKLGISTRKHLDRTLGE